MKSNIAVVIPTKDRPQDLVHTIETVANQTVLPDELIIVDQSRVKVSIQHLPFPLTHIYDPAIAGAAQARNRALDLVTKEFVLFLDDDVDLETDFIAQILASYVQHPEADGISGVITNYSPPSMWRRLHNRIFRLGRFFDERHPIYWKADKLKDHAPMRVYQFTGCLMSFRRSRVGNLRFDERITGACDEDSDFCYALGKSAVLFIAPSARLRHLKSPVAREKSSWLEREARTGYFFFCRYYKSEPSYWMRFAWFNIGLVLLTVASALRRRSLQPFRDFRSGARIGRELGTGK